MAAWIIKLILSNLKTIFIGVAVAFVLGLYPAGYINGNLKGKAYVNQQWAAANVAAIARGLDARKAAEAEIAADPTPVVNGNDNPAATPAPVVAPAKGAKPAAAHAVPAVRSKPVPRSLPAHSRDPYDRG